MEAQLIFKKIQMISQELEAVAKIQDNKVQKFKFRGIDDIYNALHPLLAKHGVFSVPTILNHDRGERKTNAGGLMTERVLTIQYRFYAEDGSFFDSVVQGEALDTGDKASSKAMAIAHKYVLLQVFSIPTDEVKDPDAESHEPRWDDERQHSHAMPIIKPVQKSLSPAPEPTLGNKESTKPSNLSEQDLLTLKSLMVSAQMPFPELMSYCQRNFKKPFLLITQEDFKILCEDLAQSL